MKVRSLYSLIPLLMTSPLYAAESSGDDDTMVVSASRTGTEQKDSPQAVTIITKEQIAQQRQICSGQLKLATALEFFQYRFSDSFGGNPPL